MGSVIGVAQGYKNDDWFQLIVSKDCKYSWFITFFCVIASYALQNLSFINLQESVTINICMFTVLISGIFNGIFHKPHKRVWMYWVKKILKSSLLNMYKPYLKSSIYKIFKMGSDISQKLTLRYSRSITRRSPRTTKV